MNKEITIIFGILLVVFIMGFLGIALYSFYNVGMLNFNGKCWDFCEGKGLKRISELNTSCKCGN